MKIFETHAYKIEIFIAGDIKTAEDICQKYCDDTGFCVTVEPTNYVFTNGNERGVRVGIINYARFPNDQSKIFELAIVLGDLLLGGLGQGSYTVQDHIRSVMRSIRPTD